MSYDADDGGLDQQTTTQQTVWSMQEEDAEREYSYVEKSNTFNCFHVLENVLFLLTT